MSTPGNGTIKHLGGDEDKTETVDVYLKFQLFMIAFAILYAVIILAKILRIKKNNGSKLVYFLSIILLSFRLMEILMNTFLKNTYNIAFSILIYWTTGMLAFTSYAFLKTRYVKGGTDTGYTNFKNDVAEAGRFMKRQKILTFGYILWCGTICALMVLLKTQQYAAIAFIAGNVASIATFFFVAIKFFEVSNLEEISDHIKKIIDILTTCLVSMGIVDFVSMISMPIFIKYFIVLQGAFYLSELVLAHNIPRMITNERNVEFVEFNPEN